MEKEKTNRSKNKEVYSFLQQKKAEREENLFLPAVAGGRSRLPYFVVLFSRHIRVSFATVSRLKNLIDLDLGKVSVSLKTMSRLKLCRSA